MCVGFDYLIYLLWLALLEFFYGNPNLKWKYIWTTIFCKNLLFEEGKEGNELRL